MPKVVGFPFDYKYENLDIFYNDQNFHRHAEALIKDPKKLPKEIQFLKTASAKLIKAARAYGKKQNIGSFIKWHKQYLEFLPTMGTVIAPERVLTTQIKEFLSEEAFIAVSITKETKTALEQKALLTIASSVKQGTALTKALQAHSKKFGWIGNKFTSRNPFTVEAVLERVTQLKTSAKHKLHQTEITRARQFIESKKIIANCTPQQKKLISLYQELLYWRTTRAEALAFACELTAPLFESIAKAAKLTREELLRFSGKEIISIARTALIPNASKRLHFYGQSVNGKIKIFWGKDGRVNKSIKQILEFSGTIASKGFARGKIKIIHSLTDIAKIKKGDILVAAATTPAMVPAMEKAAAIVTDTGSMSSHAAIISRELNIPCIVGTKIATKILKDGDMVEVDGNTGEIKIV